MIAVAAAHRAAAAALQRGALSPELGHETDMAGLVGEVQSWGRTEVGFRGRQVRSLTQRGQAPSKLTVPVLRYMEARVGASPSHDGLT
jgi:hypothetical protein